MKHLLRKEGFTIIEVSLVLAIAGIILTMAFIAHRKRRSLQSGRLEYILCRLSWFFHFES